MWSKLIILALLVVSLLGTTASSNEGSAAHKRKDKHALIKQYGEFQALVKDKVTSLLRILEEQEQPQSCADDEKDAGKNGDCQQKTAVSPEQSGSDSLLARIENIQSVLFVLLSRRDSLKLQNVFEILTSH